MWYLKRSYEGLYGLKKVIKSYFFLKSGIKMGRVNILNSFKREVESYLCSFAVSKGFKKA